MTQHRVQILVFTIKGCKFCERLKKKLYPIMAHFGNCAPTLILDAEEAQNTELANYHRIKDVPVTLVLRETLTRYGWQSNGTIRKDGDLEYMEIKQLFEMAAKYNGC